MTAGIDITTGQRKTLLALLRQHIPGVEVWAYGSRVRWNARPNSDLDLVAFTTPAQRHQVSELKEALGESNIPFLVDLHIWDEVPERFHAIIRKEYVVLQKAEEKREGGMVGEWKEKLLRNLLVTTKDGDWGKESPADGYVPYHIIRGTDFPCVRVGDLSSVPLRYLPKNTVNRRTLEPDDILIETAGGTRDRPTGRTLLITEKVLKRFRNPVTCASFARFLRIDRTQADPRFLFWYLQHLYEKGEMAQHQVQHTGIARFQYTRFAETQNIPLPSLPEQKTIARILGTLDDKIELNRRMNKTLEEMARAIFKSWFVDFDPVRRNADRTDDSGLTRRRGERGGEASQDLSPLRASAPPRDPNDALFPAHFQESPLGPIPQGWEVRNLDQIAHFLNGLALQKYPPGNGATFPVIKIAQLRKGCSEGADRCNTELDSQYIVEDGEVLFSWSGSLEVELWCGGQGALNQHLFKVTSNEFLKWFYYLWTLYHLEEFRFIAADKATTMGHIQRGHLTAAKVLVPPPDLLKAMNLNMAPLIDQIIANRTQSRTLATLRDTLLPYLMSGKLSVPNGRFLERELI